MPSLTLAEARTRAALLSVSSYAVDLDLTDAETVGSRSRVAFVVTEAATTGPAVDTFAELRGGRDVVARLDGRALPTTAYADGRVLLTGLEPGEHELVVVARLPYAASGDGLFRSVDPADGAAYAMAYCGMDLASHVFACFDQPDLKAPITLTVTADPTWTVLGNGVGTRPEAADSPGRWTFTTTPPIPTYLFTVCAGPWHSVSFEHPGLPGVPFAWHARASRAADLDAVVEELARITTSCLEHYRATFTPPYPFDSYDQVFAPGLNWGAMEFPGCVAYRDELLPRGEASGLERGLLAGVIAHEMAHMWFGDLVTMRWWEDSWLNESFADYMGYQVSDRAAGYADAWTDCALRRKPTGYAADRRRSTHPVAEDAERVADVDVAFGNFDMITYAKGNAVLRQLATWLGEEAFLAGADRHLVAHAFGNADLEDFLAALDAEGDRDVRGWAAAWLRTTGFDTLVVTRGGDGVPVLTREGSRPHRISVATFDEAGGLVGSEVVDVGAEPIRLSAAAGRAVVPNAGDETFAALRLDPLTRAWAADRLSAVADPLTRALLWATAVDEVVTGTASVDGLLALAARHLPPETDPVVFEGGLAAVRETVTAYADPRDLAPAQATLAAVAHLTLESAEERDPGLVLAATRALAAASADVDRLQGWLADGRTEHGRDLDADLRWTVCRRLVALGADPALVEEERERDPSVAGRLAALTCRASVPTEAAKAAAWELMWAPGVGGREFEALSRGFWSAGQADLVAPYLDGYLTGAPALAASGGQGMSLTVGLRGFPRLPLPTNVLERFRTALAEAVAADPPTVLRRSWEDRLDDLDLVRAARSAG